MKTETYDVKTDLKIGQQIFENIPNKIRPGWAGFLLSRFDNYIKIVPRPIKELFSIIDNPDRWKEAHGQFVKIRMFLLDNKDYRPEVYLLLAEMVAKVTYNASGESAPFNKDSGWHIPRLALQAASFFKDDRLEEEIQSTILIFNHNKKLKENILTAKDFLSFKKIDDILWLDWDPIGINDIAPRDEYQRYVPEIFKLLKANADRQEIANRLLKLETVVIGMSGPLERCLIIADKILKEK